MLSISAVGGSSYYTGGGGSGCGAHAHAHAAEGPAAYYQNKAEADPPGVYAHRGENVLSLSGPIVGEAEAQFARMVDHHQHPVTGEQLGRKPQVFKSVDERVAAFKRKNPRATPEQVAACRVACQKDQRHAVKAWDLTFSPPKSWSVLHAAYLHAGRYEDAEKLWQAWEAGVDAALDQIFDELAYTQHRPTGPKTGSDGGRATGEFKRATNMILAKFRHSTSRERDPQMHVHVMWLNRVLDEAGTWRSIYSPALLKAKHMLDATCERTAEAVASETLGLGFVTRADGVCREIEGISQEARDFFSSRSRVLGELAQELVDAYTAKYGVPPDASRRWKMLQDANKRTKKPKPTHPLSPAEELERWEATLAAQTRGSLFDELEEVDAASVPGGLEPLAVPFDRAAVIAQAVADLGTRRATASRSQLFHAISKRLPNMLGVPSSEVRSLLSALADEAEASAEVVPIQAKPVAAVPPSLRDPRTGRSKYEAPTPRRFTTRRHLAREDSLVARLDHRGARQVPAVSAATLVTGHRLGHDQAAAVTGILGSGRRFEVLDAPAGSGKTTMLRVLSDGIEQVSGSRIVVFTLSEIAADVARSEGLTAHNIAGFLDFRERERAGLVDDIERATYAVPRGGWVVVDEASMVDTPHMTDLAAELDAAGVEKIVLVGDTQQVDAVDAGGGFAMLVGEVERRERADREAVADTAGIRDAAGQALVDAWTGQGQPQPVPQKVHRLTEVRRFQNAWEREASKRLRDGDVTALAQYQARGRIKGAADEDKVIEQAVTGFVTDHLLGRESIVMVDTGEMASKVSDRIRGRLAEVGHVERDGVTLRDDTRAGVGDLIQTRLNDRRVGVHNREVWQVVGRTDQGVLEVQPLTGRDEAGQLTWGPTLALPASYVGTQVELAYAATIEAAQGRTTDTGHLIATRTTGKSRAYPGNTRGRLSNHTYVQVEEGETAVGRMAAIYGDDDHTQAARVAIAAEVDREKNLAHLGPQWEAMVRETRAATHRDHLVAALGDDADLVLSDPASGRVYALLRQAELTGHHPAELLRDVMAERGSLSGAKAPAAALYARIADQMKTAPLGAPKPVTFESRLPDVSLGDRENERLQYGREIGAGMDRRVTELAAAAADEAPAWAVRALGAVPDTQGDRWAWQGKVAYAAAYRERYGYTDDHDAIGRRPSHLEPEKVWLWDMAARQIGMPEHERDLAGLSDGELANRVQDWERIEAWLPRFVDDDLKLAHDTLRRLEAGLVDDRAAGADTLDRELQTEVVRDRIGVLEEIAEHRARAVEATREPRERADEAVREQERRAELDRARSGGDIDPEPVGDDELVDDDAEPEPVVVDRTPEVLAAALADWEAARGVDAPKFGSREWLALGDDDPAKAAAVTMATHRSWRLGDWLDRDAILAARDKAAEAVDLDGRVGASATGPDRVDDLAVPVDDRAGDLVDDTAQAEIAAVHAGDEDAAVVGDDADDDTVMAVLGWAQPHLAGDAPIYGTPEWLDAEPEVRQAASARAALDVWSLGENLDELEERFGPAPTEVVDEAIDAEVDIPDFIEPEPEPVVAREPEPVAVDEDPEPVAEVVDEPEPEVEPAPEPVDDAEVRFQEGVSWSLERARELADAESDPEPEPEPEPAPEPEPEPVSRDKDEQFRADLQRAREAAAILDERQRADAEPEPEPVADPEPAPAVEVDPEPADF